MNQQESEEDDVDRMSPSPPAVYKVKYQDLIQLINDNNIRQRVIDLYESNHDQFVITNGIQQFLFAIEEHLGSQRYDNNELYIAKLIEQKKELENINIIKQKRIEQLTNKLQQISSNFKKDFTKLTLPVFCAKYTMFEVDEMNVEEDERQNNELNNVELMNDKLNTAIQDLQDNLNQFTERVQQIDSLCNEIKMKT